jgi:hypothetical protein
MASFILFVNIYLNARDFTVEEYKNFNTTERWARTSRGWLEYIVTHQYNFKYEEIRAALHELAIRSNNIQYNEGISKLVEQYIELNPNYSDTSSGDVFIKAGEARGISFNLNISDDRIYEEAVKLDVEPEVLKLYNSIKDNLHATYGEPSSVKTIDMKNYKTIIEKGSRRTEVVILKNIRLLYSNENEILIFEDRYYVDDGHKVQIYNNENKLMEENTRNVSDLVYDKAIDAITIQLNLVDTIWFKTYNIAGTPMLKGGRGLMAFRQGRNFWLVLSEDGFNEIITVE